MSAPAKPVPIAVTASSPVSAKEVTEMNNKPRYAGNGVSPIEWTHASERAWTFAPCLLCGTTNTPDHNCSEVAQ
jgi:hypothetical protein